MQTPGVGLLLVQEAIGESVLAVEVRGHTDLAEHRRATTASWWSPSNACTCLTCLTNRFAGLPRTGAAASAAYRSRLDALRAPVS